MEKKEGDEFFDSPQTPSDPPAPAAHSDPGKKAVRIIALVLGALLLATGGFLGGWYGRYYALDEEVRRFLWAKTILEKNYYLPVEEAELYEHLYDSLAIDPYTEFYSPEEYDKHLAEGAGENSGTGLTFLIDFPEGETAHIFSVAENSPACVAGIKRGMYVLAFGEREDALKEGTYGDLKTFLSGRKEEFVVRCGYSEDGSDARNYTLKRESYQASFLHYADSETSFGFRGEGQKPSLTDLGTPLEGLDAKTAYIRLDDFAGNNTSLEFIQLLKTMKDRGRTNLIFDLRSNGGGYLGILGDVASHFMRNATEKNPVVTVAKTRSGQITRYVCEKNDFFSYFGEDSKVYVLADEYSASASECLLGVLVDYGTCAFSDIFLRRDENGVAKTFGKGIMQTQFQNKDGSAMKVTTATVNWPLSGKCIHGVGVTEADGAVGISAPFFATEDDVMLREVIARVCG